MNNEFPIEKFLNFCDDVMIELRTRGDIHEHRIEKLIDSVKEIGSMYAKSDSIPKSVASVLFDLSTALYSSVDSVENKKKERLFFLFDLFCHAAREALS